MHIIQSYCTESDCYKAGKKLDVKGLMLHSVGCPQPKAAPFIKNWNKSGVRACVHAIIEADGEVYQLLPWGMSAWHGGGAVNHTHIGVEMTEPATIQYTKGARWKEISDGKNTKSHIQAVYGYAVELFASLCNEYHLNPLEDGVVISHAEGHKRGIASNHADVEHIWKFFGLSMDQFRKDIAKKMKEVSSAIVGIEKNVPYLVRVSIKGLNIRTGPGTNYTKVKQIPVGVYTIVEEAVGKGAMKWGRLKSGVGWISLDYVKQV